MTPSVCFLVCVNVLWFPTTQCSILEIIFLMGLIYRSVLANMGKIKMTYEVLPISSSCLWVDEFLGFSRKLLCMSFLYYLHPQFDVERV